MVSTPASCLGGPRFKVWPRSWQPWLTFLVILLDSSKHSCSLTHSSQFIIHIHATAKHYITYTIPKVMLNNSRFNINTRKQKPNMHSFYMTYRKHCVPSGICSNCATCTTSNYLFYETTVKEIYSLIIWIEIINTTLIIVIIYIFLTCTIRC